MMAPGTLFLILLRMVVLLTAPTLEAVYLEPSLSLSLSKILPSDAAISIEYTYLLFTALQTPGIFCDFEEKTGEKIF